MVDIIIRNGRVIDPARGLDDICDIAIEEGRIVDVDSATGRIELDAKDQIVVPGLIDFHTHVYYGGTGLGAQAELMPSTGVTAVVDAGSCGCADFEDFYAGSIKNAPIPVKLFLSCCSKGMTIPGVHEDFSPELFEETRIAQLRRSYPELILGLKIRIGKEIIRDLRPLEAALAMAERLGSCPLCVHITNSPESMTDVANMMRPGDIICHMYHGTGNTILDPNGRVLDAVLNARERGVIFDSSNGNMNNSHAVTLSCLAQGFLPDVISTDMTLDKFNKGSRARSLCFIMSKYLSMGMELGDIIRCVTQAPAKLMGMAGEIGTLAPGADGSVSILRHERRATRFLDTEDVAYDGEEFLVPQTCIVGGQVFNCVE